MKSFGRPLNKVELDAYDVLPTDLARSVRLVRVPRLPGGYGGLTLGRFVLLSEDHPSDGTSPLIAHELVHVKQWTELGIVGFSYRYLRHFGRGLRSPERAADQQPIPWTKPGRRWQAAYVQIDAEVEARFAAEEWTGRNLQ